MNKLELIIKKFVFGSFKWELIFGWKEFRLQIYESSYEGWIKHKNCQIKNW